MAMTCVQTSAQIHDTILTAQFHISVTVHSVWNYTSTHNSTQIPLQSTGL